MFSVCADGSVVWYFWCPGCRVELRFLYCDDVRLCCEQEMFKFFHGAPYTVCVELKNLSPCVLFWRSFVCCVCGSVRVWGCEGLEWVLLGWRRMEVCVMGICGENRDV